MKTAEQLTDLRGLNADELTKRAGEAKGKIVLFDHATTNLIVHNRVARAFDGIVVTDSSRNLVNANAVDQVVRFGIRVAHDSTANRFSRNAVSRALLGLYIYGGAIGNSFFTTSFSHNYENVRVRADAPRNAVRPVPSRSEFR